jgi:hypothetical protein
VIPRISIRLVLYTDLGPAGFRLERGTSLPVDRFDFDDTPEGRIQAEDARAQMQPYCDKFHAPKSGKKL